MIIENSTAIAQTISNGVMSYFIENIRMSAGSERFADSIISAHSKVRESKEITRSEKLKLDLLLLGAIRESLAKSGVVPDWLDDGIVLAESELEKANHI